MHVKIFWLKCALEHILAAKSQDLLIKVSNTDGIITAHKIMTIISLHTKILHEIPLQTRGTGNSSINIFNIQMDSIWNVFVTLG